MTRVYYREAVGAIIVFDLTRHGTLETVKKWKADIDAKVRLQDAYETPIPVILLANKVCICIPILSSIAFYFSHSVI